MKRKTKIFFSALVTIALLTSIGGAAQKPVKGVSQVDYKFVINDEGVDASKYLVMSKNNTTYVPLRFISEKLGASVDFSQGIISIQMMSTPSRPVVPTDTQKIQELEKKLELVLKENSELRSNLEKANSSLEDKNVYKKIPVTVEKDSGLQIDLISLVNDSKDSTSLNVKFTNKDSRNYFYLNPSRTTLTVDGKTYSTKGDSGNFVSGIPTRDSKLGDWYSEGSIYFPKFDIKNAKGYVTFFYDINDSSNSKTVTIYFQN